MPTSISTSPLASSRFAATRAFTMIEILIVVVILGIIAAVAAPMVGNRSDLKVTAATRKLVADLQYAQNYAIATRQSIYIQLNDDVYTLSTLSGSTLTALTHPIDKNAFTVQLGSTNPSASALAGVSLRRNGTTGASVIGFDSMGVPFNYNTTTQVKTSMSAACVLNLACGSTSQLVNIEPYTGEISVP